MVKVGLYLRLEAKTGDEMDVENLLREALPLADEEEKPLAWFAVGFGPSTFAIFDAFPDEDGREASWLIRYPFVHYKRRGGPFADHAVSGSISVRPARRPPLRRAA